MHTYLWWVVHQAKLVILVGNLDNVFPRDMQLFLVLALSGIDRYPLTTIPNEYNTAVLVIIISHSLPQ